jgi:protein tyrosine phosphatase
VLIHDAILEAVTCGDTQIESGNLRTQLNKLQRKDQLGKTGLELQFAVLDQVSPNPSDAKVAVAKKNAKKNRSKDFLPLDKWRVVIKGESPDYINASVAHGYKQHRAFIIAQGPMQSTVRDFWKIVHDRKCGVIVMLSDLVEEGKEVCYQYWPGSGSQTYGEFSVELLGEESLPGFTLRTLGVFSDKSGKSHQVSHFHITNWAPDGSCNNIKTVTDVIEEVGKVQRRTGNHPILAHCSDTVSRSGMFCAIATTIERCKTEGVVDVFQVVKALRVQKPGAVRTVAQFHTLFGAMLVYLDSFDTYNNFQHL